MKGRSLYRSIESISKTTSKEENVSAFRLYKAVVTVAPDPTTYIGKIRFVGETTQISVPFVNNTKTSAAGDIVWVATVFDSLRNAVAWAKKDLSVTDDLQEGDSSLNTALQDRLDGLT